MSETSSASSRLFDEVTELFENAALAHHGIDLGRPADPAHVLRIVDFFDDGGPVFVVGAGQQRGNVAARPEDFLRRCPVLFDVPQGSAFA
jgi:hypothetical protein